MVAWIVVWYSHAIQLPDHSIIKQLSNTGLVRYLDPHCFTETVPLEFKNFYNPENLKTCYMIKGSALLIFPIKLFRNLQA